MNQLLKPLADGKTIIWTDWSGFFTLADGRLRPDLQDDGLHPNAKGYAEWAKVAVPFWKGAVESRPPSPAVMPAACATDERKARTEGSYVAFGAEKFYRAIAPDGFSWQFVEGLGRGAGAMEVFPRLEPPTGAKLLYRVKVPAGVRSATVTVVTRSTLAFARAEGHRYAVGFAGVGPEVVNFNARLNEAPENIYSVFYPTVARRVVSKGVRFDFAGHDEERVVDLEVSPLDQGVAFENIVVDFGGAPRQYLLGLRHSASRQ